MKNVYVVKTQHDGNISVNGNIKKCYDQILEYLGTEKIETYSYSDREELITYNKMLELIKDTGSFYDDCIDRDGDSCWMSVTHFNLNGQIHKIVDKNALESN